MKWTSRRSFLPKIIHFDNPVIIVTPIYYEDCMFSSIIDNLLVIYVKPENRALYWNSQDAWVPLIQVVNWANVFFRSEGVLVLHYYGNNIDTTRAIHTTTCTTRFCKNIKYRNCKQVIPTSIGKEQMVPALPLGSALSLHYRPPCP
jgi:hypothetical protein